MKHLTVMIVLLSAFPCISVVGEPPAAGAQPMKIERLTGDWQLFVDRTLIGAMSNVTLKLHEPVSGGVAIRIDKPWEGPANMGLSVIHHGGRYLMYYRAFSLKDKKDKDGVGCVAESQDGVTWNKPALNLVSRPEWPDNNIVATDAKVPAFSFPCTPWVDTRPGVAPNERIKVFKSEPLSGKAHTAMNDPPGPKRLVFWGSGDGFTFRKLDPQPEFVSDLRNSFDGGNTMFWSEAEQQYVLYYRFMDRYRTVARTTSKDFLHWSAPVPMTYGDTPREQFYVNNTQPYFRALHIYIALAARFMAGRKALTEAQAADTGLQSIGSVRFDRDCSDAVMLTSRAGSTAYDRTFMETFVRPGPGHGNWGSRSNFPLTGIFPCGKDRIMFWVARHFMQDTWYIERQLLRTDGFASVSAPHAGGRLVTKPFTFRGGQLEINHRTGAAGHVRVGILDADGRALPGRAHSDCPEIIGDEIDRVVAWKDGPDVTRLAGQTICLCFEMKEAELYSFRFRTDDTGEQKPGQEGSLR